MTQRAKVFVLVTCGIGLLVLAWAATQLTIANFGLFGMLSLLAIFSAGLKLPIPGLDGNISLGFVSVVLSTTLLSLPEAILITLLSAAAQSTIFAKTFRPIKAAFNCGALVVSITLAGGVAQLLSGPDAAIIRLALAGGIYYLANSGLVTIVIGLAENRQWSTIWNDCSKLCLPYFAAGLACAMIALTGSTSHLIESAAQGTESKGGLQVPGLSTLPLLLLARQYFKSFHVSRRVA